MSFQNQNIYILIDANQLTNTLLNLSTSMNQSDVVTLPDGRLVLEFTESHEQILPFEWYTAQEIVDIRNTPI